MLGGDTLPPLPRRRGNHVIKAAIRRSRGQGLDEVGASRDDRKHDLHLPRQISASDVCTGGQNCKGEGEGFELGHAVRVAYHVKSWC